MNIQFYYSLNVIMLSRLFFLFQDKPSPFKNLGFMLLLQFAGLFFYELKCATAALAIGLVLVGLCFYLLEKRGNVNLLRLLSLLVYAVLLSVFFSPWVALDFNPVLFGRLLSLGQHTLFLSFLSRIDWFAFNVKLAGLLLATNEANHAIRYGLHTLKIVSASPTKLPVSAASDGEASDDVVDQREYSAGKVIGILERILVYVLILDNQFQAKLSYWQPKPLPGSKNLTNAGMLSMC